MSGFLILEIRERAIVDFCTQASRVGIALVENGLHP
jgi:hypothetical protein